MVKFEPKMVKFEQKWPDIGVTDIQTYIQTQLALYMARHRGHRQTDTASIIYRYKVLIDRMLRLNIMLC